jgi:hypothetical protein
MRFGAPVATLTGNMLENALPQSVGKLTCVAFGKSLAVSDEKVEVALAPVPFLNNDPLAKRAGFDHVDFDGTLTDR